MRGSTQIITGGSATFATLGGVPGDNAALAAALAAKLDKAGGTMTGALNLSAGTNAAPSVNFGDASTGLYKYATNNIGVTCNGTMRWCWNQDGSLYNNGAALVMNSSYAVMPALYLRTNGLCMLLGASDDVRIERAAAATLQLGSNHATTATAQTIKAHNVTTGVGADLILKGGTGSVADGYVKIGASTGGLAFFGAGGSLLISGNTSTNISSAGAGNPLLDDTQSDGGIGGGGAYTFGGLVAALKSYGIIG